MRKAFCAFLSLVIMTLVFSVINIASAADVLPPGFLIGDTDGIHVSGDGEYFIYADKLRPGDTIYKTLIINNLEDSTFELSMTATPLSQTGPIDLLDKIHLKLILDGEEIYDGRVYGDDGVNMILNSLPLGEYSHGDMKTMQIELVFDKSIPRELLLTKSVAEVRWNFYAVKKAGPNQPNTGETINLILMFTIILFGVLSIIFLVLFRVKESKHKSEDK